MSVFRPAPPHFSFPDQEVKTLELWNRISAFERSVEIRCEQGPQNAYIFYDGPPFATGLPHYGHFVASTIKDVVGRYWTMRGKWVERRFGWDTHGLPIEMETEKTLGLSGPTQIRDYGVDKFNEACRSGVLKYVDDWEKIIGRLGRWVDFNDNYKTMDMSFMESVWWVFGQLWNKKLVYQDFRVMPYSWRLSTPLSNFEANLDYRDVQDPAVTVRYPLVDDEASLLIWTTTPWSLPANQAVAVGEDIDYVRARFSQDNAIYIVAQERLEATLGSDATVLSSFKGSELLGKRYVPPFDYFKEPALFVIVPSGHVTTESGTGLVHMAPAFGQDDFDACKKAGLPFVAHDTVDAEGRFADYVTPFNGQNIKEADPKIIRALKDKALLFKHETIQHSYPFCWRSGTPLMYKAVPSWMVRVTELKDKLIANNKQIHWVPEAVGEKRFGNWLADAQDWSISRNRFWGTPIPVWECETCHARECISSARDLEEKSQSKVTDLHPHRIDHLQWACACGGQMKRISEVFDCWFESGSMPYAQIHYPFEKQDEFEHRFPAQFIAEGLDQTRAWFYTLLVLSTALFDEPPFKNVIVNGLVLAEDGSKMSKSKRNYPDPMKVLNEYGADALRAYLINSPVVRAEPLLFNEKGVREVVRGVMLPLYNVWSFFTQYANIDNWRPGTFSDERPEMDRWILSKLNSLVREVNTQMEGYYLYRVIPPMLEFIDDLTNWYIRLGRRRFWKGKDEAAYATLYEVLVTFSKVIAPVLPFMAETLYQNLVVDLKQHIDGQDSVHLCDFPVADISKINTDLEKGVDLTRQVVGMGRALREKHRIKTRQPLKQVTVVTHDLAARQFVLQHAELIKQELNVKDVRIVEDDDGLCDVSFKPNFKTLGKKFGPKMKAAGDIITQFTRQQLSDLQQGKTLAVEGESVGLDDVLVTRTARADIVIETENHLTVALETQLDEELVSEGLMRETLSQLQKMRKDNGFEVTDRISLMLFSPSEQLLTALSKYKSYIEQELLAVALEMRPLHLMERSPSTAGEVVLQIDEQELHVAMTLETK